MCRFNSGVRRPFSLSVATLGSRVCAVLLPPSSRPKIQVVLASRVGLEYLYSFYCYLSIGLRPDVHFHCDIESDPFIYMEDHNKLYGFTISLYEFAATIETLWKTVKSTVFRDCSCLSGSINSLRQ